MTNRSKSANSLVGMLIVVAIIAILVVVIYGNRGSLFGGSAKERPDGKGQTFIGVVKYAAKDDECRNSLSQLRASVLINTDPVDGTRPSKIEDTRLGASFYTCPVGGEPYSYDSKTGTVHCPHRGHEGY